MKSGKQTVIVSVVIPAYNESAIIEETLKALKQNSISNDEIIEIIVVDDGSTDNTAEIAARNDVSVIKLKKNVGKGMALREGIKISTGEVIVFLDADVGSTAIEVKKIIKPVLMDKTDVAIARFGKAKRKGGFGIVKLVSRYGVKILTGTYVESVLSGQRAFKSEIAKKMKIAHGFGAEVGMTIDLIRQQYRINQYDVNMHHIETGRNLKGFIHRGKQLLDIICTLISKMRS